MNKGSKKIRRLKKKSRRKGEKERGDSKLTCARRMPSTSVAFLMDFWSVTGLMAETILLCFGI